MQIKQIQKKEIVLIVDEISIDDVLVDRILKFSSSFRKIGLDMKYVKTISSEKFISSLLKNKFRLFNLQSEVLAYLAIVLKDGFLKSHINKSDFHENKRELVKRSFLVA